jgi:uncharacterized repeat protein (TIGR03803 family)
MKTHIKNLFLLPSLVAGLGLIPAGRVTAQTFTTLHSFNGSDGASSYASLILSGNTLYGTAAGGSSSGIGTVFALNTNGTGFTNLFSFSPGGYDSTSPIYTNSDGAKPWAGLILSGNTLYGTANEGGITGNGTVFAINTDGTGFTNLHIFTASSDPYYTNSDGALSYASLILLGDTLYGTAAGGGSSGNGTVFAINTDGTGFTNLHSFLGSPGDGSAPIGGLITNSSGNTLYGTTYFGGSSGNGTVFAINTDGTGFTNLHNFISGSDGAKPYAGLILLGNTLYGTAQRGGSSGNGTVFAMNTDGTSFTNLHNFIRVSDGANPSARLVLSSNTLYGVAAEGGGLAWGTIFAVNTNSTGFTNLHSFAGNPGNPSEGSNPYAGLILSDNTLYGTSYGGGNWADGTVFSLSLGSGKVPQLTISPSGANVILTWPTNASGFTLQSAPSVTGNFTNIPAATSPYTNPITGLQKYFRLISN